MSEEEPKHPLADGLKVFLQARADWEQKLKDPVKRQAWELVQAGEELFWRKRYDDGIQKLAEAAALDSEYLPKLEAYRKLKVEQLRKGPVNLTRAVNRILFPRLQRLGFRQRFEEDGPKWKEGSTLVRNSSAGLEGVVHMGRSKFGKEFGLNVARSSRDGKWAYLDLRTIGLGSEALRYLNQHEADAVLERVATAFEGPILSWLEDEGHE